MKTILIAVTLLFAAESYACQSNFQCGIGGQCIKGFGKTTGQCYKKKVQYYKNWTKPKAGKSCSYAYQCSAGGRCLKASGKLTGVCSK